MGGLFSHPAQRETIHDSFFGLSRCERYKLFGSDVRRLLTTLPVHEHLTHNLDFGFLKNSFDGRGLVVHDMHAIRTGRCPVLVRPGAPPYWILERLAKYEARGFSFELEETARRLGDVLPAVELRSRGSLLGVFVKLGDDPVRDLISALDHWLRLEGFRLAYRPEDVANGRLDGMWRGLLDRWAIFDALSDLVWPNFSVDLTEVDSIMIRRLELE